MKFKGVNEETPMMVVRNNNNNNNNNTYDNIVTVVFKECMKNHAIDNGGHVLDGCGEFLPVGPEGSLDALKCVVCNCHRNFHRKEDPPPPNVVAAPVPAAIIPAGDAYPPYSHHCHQVAPPLDYTMYRNPPGYLHATTLPSGGGGCSALALTTPPSSGGGGGGGLSALDPSRASRGGGGGKDHGDAKDNDNGGRGSSSNSMKRFRTKFTPEQKEKMLAFAESVDWKILKKDNNVAEEFCNENGVNLRVLKVWMHNKKYTHGKKEAKEK